MREQQIRYWVRGSAAGCLVLHIAKVSQVDPVKLGLRFDRFLSSNRIKPPDVDLDVEHPRRDEVIDFLDSRWSVRQVGSHMKYSLFADDDNEGDHSKGSLRVRFYSTLHKRGIEHPPQWRDVPKADKEMLFALSDRKLISGYGRHAAGYIVAPNQQVLDQLPTGLHPGQQVPGHRVRQEGRRAAGLPQARPARAAHRHRGRGSWRSPDRPGVRRRSRTGTRAPSRRSPRARPPASSSWTASP